MSGLYDYINQSNLFNGNERWQSTLLLSRGVDRCLTPNQLRATSGVPNTQNNNRNNNSYQTYKNLVGSNIDDVKKIHPNIRVVVKDGKPQPMTREFQQNRINVETKNDTIVAVLGLY